jgi:hypothetical protein
LAVTGIDERGIRVSLNKQEVDALPDVDVQRGAT